MNAVLDLAEAHEKVSRLMHNQSDDRGQLTLDPRTLERDLARLVLAIMEMLRELMELQAIRRFEAGSLTADQEEHLGEALFQSRAKLREIAASFGLSEEDLTLGLSLDTESL